MVQLYPIFVKLSHCFKFKLSVKLLLLVVVFVALASLDLADRLYREQIVKVTLLCHLVQSHNFVDVAHTEPPMRFEDREEGQRDTDGPYDQCN